MIFDFKKNKRKATREIENICNNRPELYDLVVEKLQRNINPKEVIALYKEDKIKVSEEVNTYGQSSKK